MRSYQPVEALLRGLDILQALASLGPSRIKDVESATQLSGATVVRMLETLVGAGYVYQDGPRGRYALTRKVATLATGYDTVVDLIDRARPALAELQRATGWPGDLAVRDGNAMLTIATSPAGDRLPFNQPAGFRASMIATSLGLAYLAHAPEAEREMLLGMLVASDGIDGMLAADPIRLRRKLRAVRRLGYATIDRVAAAAHQLAMLQTVGVPILAADRPIAAINLTFVRGEVSIRDALRSFLPLLKAAAAEIACVR